MCFGLNGPNAEGEVKPQFFKDMKIREDEGN